MIFRVLSIICFVEHMHNIGRVKRHAAASCQGICLMLVASLFITYQIRVWCFPSGQLSLSFAPTHLKVATSSIRGPPLALARHAPPSWAKGQHNILLSEQLLHKFGAEAAQTVGRGNEVWLIKLPLHPEFMFAWRHSSYQTQKKK